MQQLTPQQVNDKFGGQLPHDAELVSEIRPPPTGSSNRRVRAVRGNTSERFALLNAFIDGHLSVVTETESKVWFILFRDTKAKSGYARTGQTDIARRAGVTVRAVQKAINQLQAKQYLKLIRRGRLNIGPSTYEVRVPSTMT